MEQLELHLDDPPLVVSKVFLNRLLNEEVTIEEYNRKLREAFFEDLKNGEPCTKPTTL